MLAISKCTFSDTVDAYSIEIITDAFLVGNIECISDTSYTMKMVLCYIWL